MISGVDSLVPLTHLAHPPSHNPSGNPQFVLHKDGQQIHEKMLNITHHRENANQTTMRYHYTLSEWLKSTTQETPSVDENVKKKEPSCTIGGNVNWCSYYGKQYEFPQKITNRITI